MAPDAIYFHFKATSKPYILNPAFFPAMHRFLSPHAAPQAKQIFTFSSEESREHL